MHIRYWSIRWGTRPIVYRQICDGPIFSEIAVMPSLFRLLVRNGIRFGITCRIVTPNLNGVIILQVKSYRVTIVQVVNICINYTIQDIICSIETNL